MTTSFKEVNTMVEEVLFDGTVIPTTLHPEINYVVVGIIAAVIMCTISVVGLLGNSAVLFIILKYKEMQNITNYFIANLAITDIALLTICTIPTCLFSANIIKLTDPVCKTIQYMQFSAVQATCCTLTAMSIDRYYLIVHAVKSRQTRTTRKAVIINVVIWIGSFVIHFPVFILSKLKDDSCQMSFTGFKYYFLFLVLIMYVIPLSVITACYANILVIVWRKTSAGTESAQAHERSIRQKKKTTRMVFLVILAFALCWLPIHTFNLTIQFQEPPQTTHFIVIMNVFALCLSYANSCVNPFIYAFTTATFKKHFKKVFSLRLAESDTSAGAKDDSVSGYRKVAKYDMSSVTCDTKV